MLDSFDMPILQLYYQTFLDTPITFGYVSRTPTSTSEADQKLSSAASQMRGDVLYWRYGFRYFIIGAGSGYDQNPTLYRDRRVVVYELWKQVPRTRAQFTVTQPDVRVGELLAKHSIGQTFTARFPGLDEVGFYLTSYVRALTGPLVFHLRNAGARSDNKRPDLAQVSIDLSTLTDNSVKLFHFKPIQASSGRRFYAYLEAPRSSAGFAPSVAGSVQNSYSGGNLTIDSAPERGDLVLQLYFRSRR